MSRNTARTPNYVVAHRQLLTEDEEKALFVKWYSLKETPLKAERVLEQIVRCYTPIVQKCAKRFAGYEIDSDDLISEGVLALVEAARRFDASKGFRFATFCRSWVEGLMLAYITKNYFMVNVCSNQRMKKLFFNLRRIVNREMRLTGRLDPSPEFLMMVAEKLEVSVEEVITMYNLFRKPYDSLSEPMKSDEEEFTREATIASADPDPETICVNERTIKFRHKLVQETVARVLTDRERMIFEKQVLSEEDDMETLQDLARTLGLSKERVRQIRNVAQRKVEQAILSQVNPGEFADLFSTPAPYALTGGENAY